MGPRPMLRLLELQARTGMTIKMLGDREQVQSIEAGDTIALLKRVLPKTALPEVLTAVRQKADHDRKIAALFREGEAEKAFLKREDGTAKLLEGDYDQVVRQIADLYIARDDVLKGPGPGRRDHHHHPHQRRSGRHQPGDPRAPEGARRDRDRRADLQGGRLSRRQAGVLQPADRHR
ncbi:MAG TPA: AAA family ATPase [Roseiarcus sp.]